MDEPISTGSFSVCMCCAGREGGDKLTLDCRIGTIFIQDSERQFGIDNKNVGSRIRLWLCHFQTLRLYPCKI